MPNNHHVRNLGVRQDKPLTVEKHVSPVTKACYYQIPCISKIRKFITTDACRSSVQSIVTSRMWTQCPVLWPAKSSAQQTCVEFHN